MPCQYISMMYCDSNLEVKQMLLLFIFTFYFTVNWQSTAVFLAGESHG